MFVFYLPISSVAQFSCSVMSDSLRLHESQHARPPCPSPTPGVHLNPCPLSRWCDPTISSSVVPFSSCPQTVAQSCPTLCDPVTAASQVSLSITNSWCLLKLMSIEAVVPSNHHILCHPLLLLPSVFPNIRIFSNESVLHIRQPNYLSFSISPSNEYSGLISFRIDKIDILTVQGTLKSLTNTTVQKYQFSAHSFLYSPSLTSWSVRSMNQGKLEVVKQEMTRVNIGISGIRELMDRSGQI